MKIVFSETKYSLLIIAIHLAEICAKWYNVDYNSRNDMTSDSGCIWPNTMDGIAKQLMLRSEIHFSHPNMY